MSVKMLVCARNIGIWEKGDVVDIRRGDSKRQFGRLETLPDFVRIEVTDGTTDNTRKYLDEWVHRVSITKLGNEVDGQRVNVAINPGDISTVTRTGRELHAKTNDHLRTTYAVRTITEGTTRSEYVFPAEQNLRELIDELEFGLRTVRKQRREAIADSVVNAAAALGVNGQLSLTMRDLASRNNLEA